MVRDYGVIWWQEDIGWSDNDYRYKFETIHKETGTGEELLDFLLGIHNQFDYSDVDELDEYLREEGKDPSKMSIKAKIKFVASELDEDFSAGWDNIIYLKYAGEVIIDESDYYDWPNNLNLDKISEDELYRRVYDAEDEEEDDLEDNDREYSDMYEALAAHFKVTEEDVWEEGDGEYPIDDYKLCLYHVDIKGEDKKVVVLINRTIDVTDFVRKIKNSFELGWVDRHFVYGCDLDSFNEAYRKYGYILEGVAEEDWDPSEYLDEGFSRYNCFKISCNTDKILTESNRRTKTKKLSKK